MSKASLLALALLAAACTAPPPVPWDSEVPAGGHVIYTVNRGLGLCDGVSGCPTRIISVQGTCITEIWRYGWEFRESKPCAATEAAR